MLMRARPLSSTHPIWRLEIEKATPYLFALISSYHRTRSCSNFLISQPRHSRSFYPGIPQTIWTRSSMTKRRWTKLNHSSSFHAKAQAQYPEEAKTNVDGSVSIVDGFVDFLNESWTQFHATAESRRLLLEAGFKQLREQDEWDVQPGGRYFFTRNMSCIIAFAVGEKYVAGKGFHVIAAHTDSPCPKLKPVSATSKLGFLSVNVQPYGAGLWHTWFDRDLSVAGRAILKTADGSLSHKLIKVKRPILRIPTLAIHLDRSVNTDGFKPNLETHLMPVLASQIKADIFSASDENVLQPNPRKSHHPLLLQVLAEELGCDVEEIADFELNVCDTQPSCLGGARNEFIYSGRLDNLASSFCALRALLDTCSPSADLSNESCIRMVALFDNEEVGSNSAQGAGAPTMFQAMKRITKCLTHRFSEEGIFERAIRKSFLVSADMAHGVHPNYSEKYEDHHQPKLQKGIVIKHNANQRYATNTVTSFLFKEVASINHLPTQDFVVRNDMGCGSTIGPILASGVGIRTVDCGIPQLSMHSRQKVSVHWCGCYIRVLQLSCMVVMILVVTWASCNWIPSHVLGILLLGFSSYNLVRVHFHDSVRSGCSSSNSISQSVLLICSFGSSGSCHQGVAVMTSSFLSVSVGPSPSHY